MKEKWIPKGDRRFRVKCAIVSLVILVGAFSGEKVAAEDPIDSRCGQLMGEDDPDEAALREDWPAAIAAQRVSVSLMCDHIFRWMTLAAVYQMAGKNAEEGSIRIRIRNPDWGLGPGLRRGDRWASVP